MEGEEKKLPRINLRVLLFCAVGLCFGCALYSGIRFGGLLPSDLLLPLGLLALALPPFSLKRTAALLLSVCVFAGVGSLSLHLFAERYYSKEVSGDHTLYGTVLSVAEHSGYSIAVLGDLSLDGAPIGGKCRAILSGTSPLPADRLRLEGKCVSVSEENFSSDPYLRSYFSKDIRYTASGDAETVGKSENLLLRLNGRLRSLLTEQMGGEEGELCYALLTGNSGSMDEGVAEAARRGGIAHIFAVSGLHIGILYAVVCFLFSKLGRYRYLPALLTVFLYAGLCNFTVSSVRAVVMCGVAGLMGFLGKKQDLLSAISLAAVLILPFAPAQWFAAGFRLSFGACVGIALFAGSFSRLLRRIRLPEFVKTALSSTLSAQLFTLPVLFDSFGYVPVWSLLLNLVLVPLLPVFFSGLLFAVALSLLIPPAAGVFLLLPKGIVSLLLLLFSRADFFLVISGFSLGAGAAVWTAGAVLLSERFRLGRKGRAVLGAALAALFAVCVLFENVVFTGCRAEIFSREEDTLVFLRTGSETVLVLDGDESLKDAEDFLLRRTVRLDAAIVLGENEEAGIGLAAALGAETVYARTERFTGLQETHVVFAERFLLGEMEFRYESAEKLLLLFGGLSAEIDLNSAEALGTDLFLGGGKNGVYLLGGGEVSRRYP